jgi:hypothetical protein
VLRVHTRRFPTVDAYQPPLASSAPEPGGAATRGRRTATFISCGGVYLCSFDVRAVERSLDGRVQFNRVPATPAGAARLVVHARRCDLLRDLLEAAETVRVLA